MTPIARRGFIALLLVGGFAVATGGIGSLVPSGFLPDEDQGAFMAEVQLPDASSTNRTLKSMEEVEKVIAGRPWMQSMFTVSGYSLLDGLNLPNRGLVVVELKPFAERNDRTLTVFHALKEVNAAFAQIASANVFAFNLPPIMGLGNSSGFEFVVQSLAGAPPVDLAAVARGMMVSAQQVPELANVFTTYAASTPQINLKLDRERAQALGVTISDIFSAMQTTLGGTYTNDFNLFGRVWQVKVQADAPDRGNVNDVFRVRVRSSNGELLPLQAVANIELITAPSSIVRYNNLRSVVLNGAPAPGYSSGQAIGAMERLAKATLPAGYGFEWTGTALQEKAASGQTGFILALAVLFAYLFLVGLYESTAIPIAALLSVVVGLFGAVLALYISGLDNNIFAQIGIVVLIALAAKNAILIIEFAMEERAHGKDIVSAATTAAGLRFRAVMMTSFAFILGLVPLVIASGAGAATQRAVGTAVFGGMIAASMLGIFVIPGLYVAFQTFREKVKGIGSQAGDGPVQGRRTGRPERSVHSFILLSAARGRGCEGTGVTDGLRSPRSWPSGPSGARITSCLRWAGNAPYAFPASWSRIGRLRMRLPLAAKIALASAGATGGTPGSPTPPSGLSNAVVFSRWVRISVGEPSMRVSS